ncbi:MAG: tetratricopeptide repeat protein [Rickettsiales bacterium]|jgi:tetratricopeptide (TPR) repeat protein|nr:tetratricopeptide repeat protein [Rickettsiales bacterium]
MNPEHSFNQLADDQPTTEAIQEKKALFAEYFQSFMKDKIKKYTALLTSKTSNIDVLDAGLGIGEIHIGKKCQRAIATIDWLADLPGLDQVPGNRFFGNTLKAGIRLGYVNRRQKQLNTYEGKLEVEDNLINAVLKEVSLEVVRIFEFQIAALKKDDLEKVAKHAMKRIMKGLGQEGISFDRNDMLGALVSVSKISQSEEVDTILMDDQGDPIKWNIDSIFRKPGLRYEVVRDNDQQPTYEFYKLQESEDIKPDKYGYRNRIMSYSEDIKEFIEHRVDEALKGALNSQKVTGNFCYYQPMTRIIGFSEIQEYLIISDDQQKSLNQIITEKYTFDNRAPVQTVYRDIPIGTALINIGIERIESSNFIGVDFVRADFTGIKYINADFTQSLLLFANFRLANLGRSVIIGADLTFANLQRVNLEEVAMKGANLDFSDLSSATIGDNEDFLNAQTDNAVIGEIGDDKTIINPILVANTFKALQSQILNGNLQIEELRVKYDQLEIMYKALAQIERRCNFDQPDRLYQRGFGLVELVLNKLELGKVALTGIFGSGKSYLAQSSLRSYLDNNPDSLVWKLDASSEMTIEEGYRELAHNIGMEWKRNTKFNGLINEIATKLASNNQIQKVILFYDNAINNKFLASYTLGGLDKTRIIVTSQQREFFAEEEYNIREEQIKFTPQEAIGFLTNNKAIEEISLEDQTKYQDLAESFNYLPIGLAIARDYMHDTRTTILDYCNLISDQDVEQYIALSPEFKPLYIPLYNALRLSLARLTPKSKAVLYQTAFLSGQAIPLLLLPDTQGVHRNIDAGAFASNIQDSSLAQIDGEDNSRTVFIHEFVQKNIKILMTSEEKLRTSELLLNKLTKYFVKDTRFRCEEAELFTKSFANQQSILSSFDLNQLLLPHVENLLQIIDKENLELSLVGQLNQIKLFNVLGYFYTQIGGGRAQESEYWLMQAKDKFEQVTGLKKDIIEQDLPVLSEQIYNHLQNFALTNRDELESFYPNLGVEGKEWVGLKTLQSYYFTELYVSILYSLGRTYFYDKKTYISRIEIFKGHLQLANELSHIIEKKTDIKIIHQYLTETNGLLYFDLEDKSNKDIISNVVSRYNSLAEDKNYYYEEGKLKKQPEDINAIYSKITCYKQIVLACDLLKKSNEARQYLDKLELQFQALEQKGRKSERIAGFYNLRGNNFLEDISSGNLKLARESFLRAYNEEKSKTQNIGKTDYPLFDACIGLGRVELKRNNHESAQLYFNEAKAIADILYPNGNTKLEELRLEKDNHLQINSLGNVFVVFDHDSYRQARSINDVSTQLRLMQELALAYRTKAIENSDELAYAKAGGLINYCINLCKDKDGLINEEFRTDVILFDKQLIEIEQEYLLTISKQKKEYNAVNDATLRYKAKLKEIRDIAKAELHRIGQEYKVHYVESGELSESDKVVEYEKSEQIKSLFGDITEKMKSLIESMIIDCQVVLGDAPCEYAIIAFGSMARKEMTPFSDFEWGILLEDTINAVDDASRRAKREEVEKYFTDLSKYLLIKIINLGETILPSLAIAELNDYDNSKIDGSRFYDDNTPRGFSMDGLMPSASKWPLGNVHVNSIGPEQRFKLIGTASELAKLHDKEHYSIDKHFTTVLSTVSLVHGSINAEELVDVFRAATMEELNKPSDQPDKTIQEKRALQLLTEALEQHGYNGGKFGEEGHYFDVKQLYRIPNLFIEHLSLYFAIEGNSVWEKLESLQLKVINRDSDQTIFSPVGANNLKIASSMVLSWRLDAYLERGEQKDDIISLDEGGLAEGRLNEVLRINRAELFRIYYSFTLFTDHLRNFVNNGGRKIIVKEDYYDNSDFARGGIYNNFLELDKALECYKKDEEIVLAEYGEASLEFANNLINRGAVYINKGEYGTAQNCFENALAIKRIKENVPAEMAILYGSLGSVCNSQGKSDAALEYYTLALEKARNISPSNPLVAKVLLMIGNIYYSRNNDNEALVYFRDALTIQREINHPDVSVTLDNIGSILRERKEYIEAMRCFSESLSVQERKLGKDHPNIAITLNNIGVWHRVQNNYIAAAKFYENALKIQKHRLPLDHPDIANTYNNIGNLHACQKQHQKALSFFDDALSIRIKQGENHQSIATIQLNKAKAYRQLELYEKAIQPFKEVLRIWNNQPGQHSLERMCEIADVLSSLGSVQFALAREEEKQVESSITMTKYEEAVSNYRNALRIWKELQEQDTLFSVERLCEVADTSAELGLVQFLLARMSAELDSTNEHVEEKLAEAMAMVRTAKEIYEHNKPNHVNYAKTLRCLGDIYDAYGDNLSSIKCYKQSANLLYIEEGESEKFSNYCLNYANSIASIEDVKEQRDLLVEIIVTYRINTLAPQHPLQQIVPVFVQISKYCAQVSFDGGEIDEAIMILEVVDNLYPNMFDIYQELEQYRHIKVTRTEEITNPELTSAILSNRQGNLVQEDGIEEKSEIITTEGTTNSQLVEQPEKIENSKSSNDVEIRHMVQVSDNPLLNHPQIHLIFQVAYKAGKIEAVNKIIDLGMEQKAYQSLIEDIEFEGVDVAVSKAVLPIIPQNDLILLTCDTTFVSSTEEMLDSNQEYYSFDILNQFIGWTSNKLDLDVAWQLRKILYQKELKQFNHILHNNNIGKPIDILRTPSDFRKTVLLKLHPDKGGNPQDFIFVKGLQEKLSQEIDINQKLADKAQAVQPMLYKAGIVFKGLDTAVDTARLIYEPTIENVKKLAFDTSYLYGMYHGVNGYSSIVSATDILYKAYQGEYTQALKQLTTTASYMALPIIIESTGPYLSFTYGAGITLYSGYIAITNLYSFYQEYGSVKFELKSTTAYKDITKVVSSSPLQQIYDFAVTSKQYQIKINNINLDLEKTAIKTQLEAKGDFGKKLYEYVYSPILDVKYDLLNKIILGELTEEQFESLRAKHIKITIDNQAYDHCIEINSIKEFSYAGNSATNRESYYCYNEEQQILDHILVGKNLEYVEIIERI